MTIDATPPLDELHEPIGRLGEDGTIEPCNRAMRTLLVDLGAARLEDLPARTRTACGIRVVEHDGERWVLARDVEAGTERLAAARVRNLGCLVGDIVHDLANVLHGGVALSSSLSSYARDDAERLVLEQVLDAAQNGTRVAGTLAKLLETGPREWRNVPAAELLNDAASVVQKHAMNQGIELDVVADCNAVVRGPDAELVQAVLAMIWFAIRAGGSRVQASVRSLVTNEIPAELGAGRAFARFRFVAGPLDVATVAAQAERLLTVRDALRGAADDPESRSFSLLVTQLVVLRLGGLVRVASAAEVGVDELALDLVLPTVRARE